MAMPAIKLGHPKLLVLHSNEGRLYIIREENFETNNKLLRYTFLFFSSDAKGNSKTS
jgi:hypothetical protein